MTTLKGRGGPGRGQGRKPRPGGARRKDYYLSNEVIEYLNRNGNQSAEIERLVRAEMDNNLLEIANAMYRELSGADNRQEKAELVDEIYNWLREGDAKNLTLADVPDLLNEWREYSGE